MKSLRRIQRPGVDDFVDHLAMLERRRVTVRLGGTGPGSSAASVRGSGCDSDAAGAAVDGFAAGTSRSCSPGRSRRPRSREESRRGPPIGDDHAGRRGAMRTALSDAALSVLAVGSPLGVLRTSTRDRLLRRAPLVPEPRPAARDPAAVVGAPVLRPLAQWAATRRCAALPRRPTHCKPPSG